MVCADWLAKELICSRAPSMSPSAGRGAFLHPVTHLWSLIFPSKKVTTCHMVSTEYEASVSFLDKF